MRTIFLVVLTALTTLPVSAAEKKPTPAPAAKKQGDVTPTPAPPAKAARVLTQQGRVDNPPITGKVISQSGNTFTVMSRGKKVTFSGSQLRALPRVGETVDISYSQTPGGPLEATTVKSSKSNSSE